MPISDTKAFKLIGSIGGRKGIAPMTPERQEAARRFASIGGSAGVGSSKNRGPEHYERMKIARRKKREKAAQEKAAQKAKG